MAGTIEPADRFWRSGDGLRLHAFDYASGAGEARQPVICLHGLTRNARDFDEVAPRIAAGGRRVLAVDVRGRGRSDRDRQAHYQVPIYAGDVIALAEALGIARALFVGTSMGGLITMAVAAFRPDLVAGAVINDVGPVLGQAGLARIGAYAGQGGAAANWDEVVDRVRRQNAAQLPHYGAAEWGRMARRMYREQDGAIIADYDPAIWQPSGPAPAVSDPWALWEGLAADRPLLVLRGETSDLLERDVAARMVAEHPAVRLVEVPAVGHAPMLDEPAAVAALDRFFAEAP